MDHDLHEELQLHRQLLVEVAYELGIFDDDDNFIPREEREIDEEEKEEPVNTPTDIRMAGQMKKNTTTIGGKQ